MYLVKENNQIETIILPVHGKGLFSTMYGFIALKADKQSIVGLKFYEQGETPGLGGEVENPRWLSLWTDKKLLNALITANQALYLEHAIRTGFSSIREEDNHPRITIRRMRDVSEILDRVATHIQSLPGRRSAWMNDIIQATTDTKSSLLNINAAQERKPSQLSKSKITNSNRFR